VYKVLLWLGGFCVVNTAALVWLIVFDVITGKPALAAAALFGIASVFIFVSANDIRPKQAADDKPMKSVTESDTDKKPVTN